MTIRLLLTGALVAIFVFLNTRAECGNKGLANIAAKNQTSSDSDGWYLSKWGMSPADVTNAVKLNLMFTKKSDNGFESYYTVNDYKIENYYFKLLFVFDEEKGLNKVTLILNDESKTDECYINLSEKLKNKYGKENSKIDEIDKYGSNHEMQWIKDSTIITLSVVKISGHGLDKKATMVEYRSRILSSGSDKL